MNYESCHVGLHWVLLIIIKPCFMQFVGSGEFDTILFNEEYIFLNYVGSFLCWSFFNVYFFFKQFFIWCIK